MMEVSELNAVIESFGLEYSARFVPQSQSRNASEKSPSLNWRVLVKHGGAELVTDYMQGIGHLPHAADARKALGSGDFARYERKVAEEGKTGRFLSGSQVMFISKPLPAPLLRDVLYCLVLEASVIDYATFEDWASEYGYDTDSRKAEKTYRACLKTALSLRAMVGDAGLTKLREAFQDY
jgi:hypothetical protein